MNLDPNTSSYRLVKTFTVSINVKMNFTIDTSPTLLVDQGRKPRWPGRMLLCASNYGK